MAGDIRFYLDEHIPSAIADGIRRRGIDVVTAQEAGLVSRLDEEHLTFARAERRVMVSADRDFLRLHSEGHRHYGIVSIRRPQLIGVVVRGLVRLHKDLDAEAMNGQLRFM